MVERVGCDCPRRIHGMGIALASFLGVEFCGNKWQPSWIGLGLGRRKGQNKFGIRSGIASQCSHLMLCLVVNYDDPFLPHNTKHPSIHPSTHTSCKGEHIWKWKWKVEVEAMVVTGEWAECWGFCVLWLVSWKLLPYSFQDQDCCEKQQKRFKKKVK